MTGGTAGLEFVDDIITLLNRDWRTNNGGKRPVFEKVWNEKTVGYFDSNYRVVLVHLDAEPVQIYSLQQRDENDDPAWDWLHEPTVTIDIMSGESEKAVLEMLNEITRILKKNVLLNINDREYVQMILGTATSRNEDYRNLWRYTLDCDAMRWNP